MQKEIAKLKRARNKRECLDKAYKFLSTKYVGHRIETYLYLWRVFESLERSWKRTGFVHCTTMNRFLRKFLLESSHFTKDEIRFRWTLVWSFSPHEYVQVKLDGKWFDVDLWGAHHGIPLGRHAAWFNQKV